MNHIELYKFDTYTTRMGNSVHISYIACVHVHIKTLEVTYTGTQRALPKGMYFTLC